MPTKQPQLAKLTRPRLHKAVHASACIACSTKPVSTNLRSGVVWTPPGAGKTTLVASWLDARDIKGIWYQVDSGDALIFATFFYYLGEAG
jgi:ATP/maltotriose-dependent transcriptional regulator MalT